MKLLALLVLALAIVVAATVAFVSRDSGSSAAHVDAPGGPYRGSEPPRGIDLPDFTLREWNGARVPAQRFRGKVVIVTFLETKCRDACPVIADQIGAGLDLLNASERRSAYAVAISTHPVDDSPRSVRMFLRRHRVQNELHYLIGSERQLRPVWRAFKVLPALDSGDADTHSAPVRVFDRGGTWVSTLHSGVDLTPGNLAHDVRVALESSS